MYYITDTDTVNVFFLVAYHRLPRYCISVHYICAVFYNVHFLLCFVLHKQAIQAVSKYFTESYVFYRKPLYEPNSILYFTMCTFYYVCINKQFRLFGRILPCVMYFTVFYLFYRVLCIFPCVMYFTISYII